MPGKSGRRDTGNFKRTFEGLGVAAENAARVALAEVANKVVARAKELAPVVKPEGKSVHATPGVLRDAISWEWNRDKTVIRIKSTAAKNAKGVSYGQYVEFDPLFSAEGPKPFLYPAMDDYRDEAKRVILEAVQAAIKREVATG